MREKKRDREGTNKLTCIIQNGNNLTTRLQELVYILTNLGQLPFTLFTQIA